MIDGSARGDFRHYGAQLAVVGAAFVGGAAIGIVILTILTGLFVVVTFGYGLTLLTGGHWVDLIRLGGLAGGVTGVIVSVLVRLARHFGSDRDLPGHNDLR